MLDMSLNNAVDEKGRIQKMNLEGANSGGLGDESPPAGSRGEGPVRGLGGQSPPEADDFSQLKASWGGHGPLPPPLKSASVDEI